MNEYVQNVGGIILIGKKEPYFSEKMVFRRNSYGMDRYWTRASGV